MSIPNPVDAVNSFVTLLRRTVACVTETPLTSLSAASGVYRVVFVDRPSVEVRTESENPNLKLSIIHVCNPVPHPGVPGTYTVRSVYYAYEIRDLEDTEILTYHWHPTGASPVTHPHLHLSSRIKPISIATLGRDPAEMSLADMHIPTGRVLLEDVVRTLIEEFKVRPLAKDWEDTLAENAAMFREDWAR